MPITRSSILPTAIYLDCNGLMREEPYHKYVYEDDDAGYLPMSGKSDEGYSRKIIKYVETRASPAELALLNRVKRSVR